MSDAFWAALFSNLGSVITAIGVVFLGYLTHKISTVSKVVTKGALDRAEHAVKMAEVQEAVATTQKATFTLQEQQSDLIRAVNQTNTYNADMLRKQISDFGKL